MKKFLVTFLVGLICIGLGCGIAVFEFSSYALAQQPTTGAFAPVTKSLICDLPDSEEPVYIDSHYHFFNSDTVTILTDDSLQNQMRLEVTGPGHLLTYHFNPNGNNTNFYFYYDVDPFKATRAMLDYARDKMFVDFQPEFQFVLYVHSSDLKRINLGRDPAITQQQDAMAQMQQDHQEAVEQLQQSYEEQLSSLREEMATQRSASQEQLATLREEMETNRSEHETQMQEQRQAYEEQLEQLRENKI